MLGQLSNQTGAPLVERPVVFLGPPTIRSRLGYRKGWNFVSKPIDLTNQVVVVTGAGRGLGRCHSLELARRGARVLVNDIARDHADAVVSEISAFGGNAVASYGSVAHREG